MKKLLYIASICIASLFSACDDYLTVESPDQLTSSSFWRNQSDAEAGLCPAGFEFSEYCSHAENYKRQIGRAHV